MHKTHSPLKSAVSDSPADRELRRNGVMHPSPAGVAVALKWETHLALEVKALDAREDRLCRLQIRWLPERTCELLEYPRTGADSAS